MTDRTADDAAIQHSTAGDIDPGRDDETDEQPEDNVHPAEGTEFARADEPIAPETTRRNISAVVIVLALGLLGVAWTLSSPVGSAPDDDFHLASIWCSSTAPADACNDQGGSFAVGQTFAFVPVEVGQMWCFAGFNRVSAGCMEQYEPGSATRLLANDGAYPGLYYNVMGLTVTDQPVNSALTARLLSWTLCMLLLAAGWWVLPRRHRSAYLMVLLVTAIPHGLFLWASTNPSGMVIAAVTAAWCAAVALLHAEDRRQLIGPGALLVIATIAAAGSRSDGGLYLFIAVVAACILLWRSGRQALATTAGVIAVAGVGLIASIVVLTRRLEVVGVGALTTPQIESPPAGSLWFNALEVPFFITGSLGLSGIGWDTTMPRVVWVSTLIVFAALVFRGIGRIDLAKGLSMIGLLAGLLVLPTYFLWRAGTVVPFEIQPRYVMPLLPAFGFTALYWRRGRSLAGLTIVQLSAVLTLLAIAHSVALHRNIRRYVTGIDVSSPNLDANREWWWDMPITPNVVWIAGSIAFATLAILLGLKLHETPNPSPDDDRAVDPSYD